MLITLFEKITKLNDKIYAPLDNLVDTLPLEDWVVDALIDSLHLLPFLFLIFIIIEILEFYYSEKIDKWMKKANKSSIIAGSVASLLPQCGFSVIASSLYSRKLITKGCLIAVYLGTSDETIPILLAEPSKAHYIVPIIGIKLFVAILAGYAIDLIFTKKIGKPKNENQEDIDADTDCKCSHEDDTCLHEEGCCNHNPATANKKELILHPIIHTVNIFCFILVITLLLNYFMQIISITDFIAKSQFRYLQIVISSIIGLIPNCATSVVITMMLIKGTVSFGAAISGLLTNAGLGLLVLLRNNDFKDTLKIIAILLTVSITIGLAIEFIS